MSSMKSLTNTFMLAIATLAITACVPKATEKKAVCGASQEFSSVTRSCYSVAELRAKPVGSVSSVAMTEELPTTITLAYTDANKDLALSCKVSSITTNLELVAPSVADGSIFIKADDVYNVVNLIADEVGTSKIPMRDAIINAKASVYYPTVVSQLNFFLSEANRILTAGGIAGSNRYVVGQERMQILNPLLVDMGNRCACTGGVCKTVAVPKLGKNGAAGFAYTITDVDGASAAKNVGVTIAPLSKGTTAHLKPIAKSSYAGSFSESTTSTASSYNITIPDGNDLTGTASSTMRYYFNGSKNNSNKGITAKGLVSGCMDLNGTSGPTDKSCVYTPNNGDDYNSVDVPAKAAIMIDDLVFTSIAEGTFANNFNIQYFDLRDNNFVSELEAYGVNSSDETYLRVEGNSIKVFINPGITSSDKIKNLINAHNQAKLMVFVTGGSTITFPGPTTSTPSPVYLENGADAYDAIPYYVNNTFANSGNAASVGVNIVTADDVPFMKSPAVTLKTVAEDVTPITIDLSGTYGDVDTSAALGYSNVCMIAPADLILADFTDNGCVCTVSGVCTQTLTPKPHASKATPFTFNYRIGSVSSAGTLYTEYRQYSLKVNQVNDAPELSTSPLTMARTSMPARTILEGGSGYVDVYIGPGGGDYETTQNVTVTVSSPNTILLPGAANLVVSELPVPEVGRKRITFTPAANQSGTATINVTLKDDDNGATGGTDTATYSFLLTVTSVDNPPVFKTSITKVETNEGGAVQSGGFKVDEDLGSAADENIQGVKITSIVSDNSNVLPVSAIKIFYDSNDNGVEDNGEARAVGDILEGPGKASDDVQAHMFYLKLDPVDGISGNANITMYISDGTSPAQTTFSFIVHPVAALHGGWENISSVGLKTDKNGGPAAAAEVKCNYNKAGDTNNCSGADCLGDASPNSTIIPNAANVIYYDKSNLRCYRSTAANAFSWVDMNTSCPITRTAGVFSGNNSIVSGDPTSVSTIVTPEMVGQYLLDSDTNTCYVSLSKTAGNWIEYTPAKVTLSWKPFIMVGSGPDSNVQIEGWNVYRRDAGTDYNFKGGHLQSTGSTTTFTIHDPSIRTFTDTTAIAGRVYYYVVRPVDNQRQFPTYTPESFSEVRVIASPSNYSFVHRWIINQEMCNGMNITTTTTPNHVDQTQNFRCEYSGPGSVNIGGVSYYDYGKDLLVDTQESGCAYAAPSTPMKCTANGCIGIGSPSGIYSADPDDLYYDRSSGICYIHTGGTAWTPFDTAAQASSLTANIVDKTRSALNAPLTRLTKSSAVASCSVRSKPELSYLDASTGNIITAPTKANVKLPNKKDYMSYSSQKINVTDPEIAEMEQGYSLNIQSRCNGSAASGLETAFTDASIPSTSFIFSLPGTFSSGIRSLYTGSIPSGVSRGTEACVSRFGIQDLYGNVAEWVNDGMTCVVDGSLSKVCTVNQGAAYSFTSADFGVARPYSFNNVIGPFAEGGDSIVTYPTDTVSVAMGAADTVVTLGSGSTQYFPSQGTLLIDSETIVYTGRTSTTLTGLVRTAGVGHSIGAPLKLSSNDDAYLTNWTFGDQLFGASNFNYPLGLPLSSNINQAAFSSYMSWVLAIGPSNGILTNKLHDDGIIVNGSAGAAKSFAVGGSYLSGTRAGRFSSELIGDSVSTRPDVGFRCIVPINTAEAAGLGDYPDDASYSYPN